jgi:Exoribonuclease R
MQRHRLAADQGYPHAAGPRRTAGTAQRKSYEARSKNLIDGTIVLHRDGYGFVIPAQKIESLGSDVFIPPPMTGSAMNGDKVQIEIVLHKPGGRAEGRVVNVTKRVRDTIVGQLRFDGKVFFVAPMDEKLPAKILITEDAPEHKDKIVEVEITRYPGAATWPAGKIVNVIGFLDDPNVETIAIIRKFGFSTSFPKNVEEEAEQLPETLDEKDYLGRDDFRTRNTITIDPTTARDFDDAVDVEILKDGSFQLGVHIADVSHVVPPGLRNGHGSPHPRNLGIFSGSRHSHAAGKGFQRYLFAEPTSGPACHERHHAHLARWRSARLLRPQQRHSLEGAHDL